MAIIYFHRLTFMATRKNPTIMLPSDTGERDAGNT